MVQQRKVQHTTVLQRKSQSLITLPPPAPASSYPAASTPIIRINKATKQHSALPVDPLDESIYAMATAANAAAKAAAKTKKQTAALARAIPALPSKQQVVHHTAGPVKAIPPRQPARALSQPLFTTGKAPVRTSTATRAKPTPPAPSAATLTAAARVRDTRRMYTSTSAAANNATIQAAMKLQQQRNLGLRASSKSRIPPASPKRVSRPPSTHVKAGPADDRGVVSRGGTQLVARAAEDFQPAITTTFSSDMETPLAVPAATDNQDSTHMSALPSHGSTDGGGAPVAADPDAPEPPLLSFESLGPHDNVKRSIPESQRKRILAGLRAGWARVTDDFNKMSITSDSIGSRNRKNMLEKQLQGIEAEIKRFENPSVLDCVDGIAAVTSLLA